MKSCNECLFVILTMFLTLTSNPLQSRHSHSSSSDSSSSEIPEEPLTADYVIVGVGTAGAILARKLSDDNTTSVIALHNGENLTQDPDIKFSKNASTTVLTALLGIPPFTLSGKTTKQHNTDNERYEWFMGLPLGGTSSINAGAYCRGTNEVYAQWEEIAGPKWSVKRILSIYKELENYHGETPNPAARGYHGPISVRQNSVPTRVSKTFTQAIVSGTGFPEVLDYNDPETPIGASLQMQYTQSGVDGRLRVSSATAFLNPTVMTPDGYGVDGRQLKVLFETTALRAIWNGNTASGVEFIQNGETKQVLANKGIIVCAGLFSSPFFCILALAQELYWSLWTSPSFSTTRMSVKVWPTSLTLFCCSVPALKIHRQTIITVFLRKSRGCQILPATPPSGVSASQPSIPYRA